VVVIETLDEVVADELETNDLATKIAQLEEELAAAQAEAAANLDQMKRVAAEFQNSKRRQEKQLADAIDRASEHVVRSLLPVLDGFDLAFQNAPADLGDEDAAWIDGFKQIQKTLLDLLAGQGVEPVAAEGEFDPNMHEAISSEPNDDVESGHIIETLRSGYTHKGQTLRPALVRVAM
jgi:molecular chaperone GrpE